MNFSRAKQRQYIALHSMAVLGDHVRECEPHPPRKTLDCLSRVERRRLALLDGYDITEKQRRNVIRKFLRATQKYADDQSDIRPVEYVNACLLMADDISTQGARPGREWNYLTQGLFTLAGHLDPDLSDPGQASGQRLGELILAEFGG